VVHARATKVLQNGTRGGLPLFNQVAFTSWTGRTYTATARQEVVLAAGVFNTPQLLMLSGIGASAELRALGIHTLVDLPSVGKNMSDHVRLANVCVDTATGDRRC
jgi:choline dehydrogenase-like flavoprotein